MWLKIRLYIVSLLPLFPMLIISKGKILDEKGIFIGWQMLPNANYIPLICFFFILLGCSFFIMFYYDVQGGAGLPVQGINSTQNVSYEYATFFATYIIPFVSINLDNIRNEINLILILLLLGAIYVRTNLFYTNPVLALFGFKVFKAKDNTGAEIIIISRANINTNYAMRLKNLGDNVFYSPKQL
jgi:hypothetical protein